MKKSHLLGSVCVCIFSLITMPSHAAIIYDNGVTADGGDCSGKFTCRYAMADDFMLSASATTITDVHWTGSYSAPIDMSLDNFTVGFYASDSGAPIDLAFAEYDLGSVTRTDLGSGLFGYETFIPALSLDAGTQYFVSIANNFNQSAHWFWTSNGVGNGDGFSKLYADSSWASRGTDFDFQLTGVPVPAAVWLFGSGLLGLVGMARRKKT